MKRARLFIVPFIVLAAGCDPMAGFDMSALIAATAPPRPPAGDASIGLFALRKGTGPAEPATFGRCASGESQGFFGVDLTSESPRLALRVSVDPIAGPRARLMRDSAIGLETYVLDRDRCSILQANLVKQPIKVGGITLLAGKIEIDCAVEGGTNIVAEASFQNCQAEESAKAVTDSLEAEADLGPASQAVVAPESVTFPPLDPAMRKLSLHLTPKIVGTTLGTATIQQAESACLKDEAEFMSRLGFQVVQSGPADLEGEFGCTGHVVQQETPTFFAIRLPATDTPSLVLKAGDRALLTVAPVGRTLRCDLPASDTRIATCTKRWKDWGEARVAGFLAKSDELRELAKSK
jgi:hypothetical protein